MPTRNASAVWEGGLKEGNGRFDGESGAITGAYSFSRFQEQSEGTNPEELLAAAEAACYSMALAATLEKQGTPPARVRTEAACTVEKVGEGFEITRMKLTVRARVPGMDEASFRKVAESTHEGGCPVSGALKGSVEFELDAELES